MNNPTILIDVDPDGTVQVYWHDTSYLVRETPEVSVVYSYERQPNMSFGVNKLINDHDSMIRAEWGTEQIF